MARRKKEYTQILEQPELEALKKRASRSAEINTWKPKKSEVITESDGNIFIVNFDKLARQPTPRTSSFIETLLLFFSIKSVNVAPCITSLTSADIDNRLIRALSKPYPSTLTLGLLESKIEIIVFLISVL